MPYLFTPDKTMIPVLIFFVLIAGTPGHAQHAGAATAPAAKQDDAPVPLDPDDLFKKLETYEFGADSTALARINELIRNAGAADPEKAAALYAAMEEAFLDIIRSDRSTRDAKDFACRQLRQVGTERAVPVLCALLREGVLQEAACFALQALPYPEVDALLFDSLPGASVSLRIGIVNIIAQRASDPHHLNRDLKAQAIDLFARLMNDADPQLACSAMAALGRLGCPEAAAILLNAEPGDSCRTPCRESCLTCADSLLAKGFRAEAATIYRTLSNKENPVMLRVAAVSGLVRSAVEDALPLINELLDDNDLKLRQVAAQCITELPDRSAIETIAARIPALPIETALLVLTALQEAGAAEAAPVVAQATKHADEGVRIAALKALGLLGGAEHVPLLAQTAVSHDAEGEAAAQSLARLRGPGVDEAIRDRMAEESGPNRAALVYSLGKRDARRFMSLIIRSIVHDSDPQVRECALLALKTMVRGDDLPLLLKLLGECESPETSKGLVAAMTEACLRADDMALQLDLLARTLAQTSTLESTALARASLVEVLGHLRGPEAMNAIRTALKDEHPWVRNSAIAALADWPDTTPTQILLKLASTVTDSEQRGLVLRGLLKMAELPGKPIAQETEKLYEAAGALAVEAADKVLIINSVSRVLCFWVLDFLEPYRKDPQTRDAAADAWLKVSAALSLTVPHDAGQCPVTFTSPPTFNPGGDQSLTDGQYGSENFRDGKWMGFNGKDMDVIVDLGRDVNVHSIRVRFMKETRSWIFLPLEVRFSLSKDGRDFSQAAFFERPAPDDMEAPGIENFYAPVGEITARYVRVFARSILTCPDWHPGAGRQAWIFIDEIQVNPHLVKPSDQ
ncbi:MAG: HEAT repeat domain-containing protein [Planctomycetota bacterium]